MDLNKILKDLNDLKRSLNCILCDKKCVEPVRIKVCGHHFCIKCLNAKRSHNCPQCDMFYVNNELDFENIAKITESTLKDLEECLGDTLMYSKQLQANVTETEGNIKATPALKNHKKATHLSDLIKYRNKTYHLNFVDDLCGKVNKKGETPLHIACKKKNLEQVRQLINKKVDLNIKDYAGWTPLHEAVHSESYEVVECLLNNGALIDVPGIDYATPLHKTVLLENEELTKLLLKQGADPTVIDGYGKNALDYAKSDNIRISFTNNNIKKDRLEELFCCKKIVAFCYHIEQPYLEKLSKIRSVVLEKEFSSKVTHIFIRRTHKISLNILLALLQGCTFVVQEWVDDFLNDNNYFVLFNCFPKENFIDIANLNLGIRKSMVNNFLKFPKLFDGINFFIFEHAGKITIHNIKFTKDSISDLIRAGGGHLLRNRPPSPEMCETIRFYPYHGNRDGQTSRCCNYIIYEEENPPSMQYRMQEIKHKSSKWLVDCIINFKLM